MERAKANYTAAMSLKEDSVDEEFKEIMESILGMNYIIVWKYVKILIKIAIMEKIYGIDKQRNLCRT